jgi:hypothetical protein
MKNFYLLTILLALIFSLSSCDQDDDCIYGNGYVVSRDLYVPAFDKVHLNGSGNVFITQGNSYRVVVETDENLFDEIETDVHNGLWEIEFYECVQDISVFNVYITVPNLFEAVINGSGLLRSENVIIEPELHLAINGSGDIDFAFDGDAITTTVAGSGEIFLEGQAHILDHQVQGWCDLQAYNLISDKVYVDISGSGKTEVTALDLLDVIISGSGDVFYKGDPQIISNISGTGRIIRSN